MKSTHPKKMFLNISLLKKAFYVYLFDFIQKTHGVLFMKKFLATFLILFLALITAACGANNAGSDEGAADQNTGTSETSADETVTVTHSLGETTVKKNPQKVVVFDFGALDSLDQMGVDIAGIPKSGTVPPYLEKFTADTYENVGSLKEPDFEKLAVIEPDLIIISGRQAELYEEFTEIAPTISVELDLNNYIESFQNNMRMLGEIFGKEDFVEGELAKIDEKIKQVRAEVESLGENALIVLVNEGKVSAFGPKSRFGIIHDVLGFIPVDDRIEVTTHGQSISFEYIVEKNPDYLFVVDRTAVVGGEGSAQEVIENDLVKNTTAYQEGKIVYLDPNFWYLSGGGLVSLAEMINEVGEAIK